MARQVRTDDRGAPVRERFADQSKRARVEAFLEDNWRTIVTVFMMMFGWYAANVYQPIRAIPGIIERDALRAEQHENIEKTVERLDRTMMVLSRISCFSLSQADRVKYDIDCTAIPLPETPN